MNRLKQNSYNQKVMKVVESLIDLPQVKMPVEEMFAPGVYLREITMPAGTFVVGHIHKTEHFNIVTQGVASVMVEGNIQLIKAPDKFISMPGVSKILYIHEDMKWITIHPTEKTDPDQILYDIIENADVYNKNKDILVEFQNALGGSK